MKARISHDTSHFQPLRQTPAKQARIPFVADEDLPEIKDAAIGTAIFVALIGALATMPWWLP